MVKQTRIIMGMPITVELVDRSASKADLKKIFDYFKYVDGKFSTYKKTSEISQFNQGQITQTDFSPDMKTIFELAQQTKDQTQGFFDINYQGKYDPSGIVKGWAIYQAAQILKKSGLKNFYIEAGGDIQTGGHNSQGQNWQVGIRNPFNQSEIVKVLALSGGGVATSGTYIRGQHIYNPHTGQQLTEVVSLTVVGPNIYEADRFATAAFAMGKPGIGFIERLKGLEGYMIDQDGVATLTSGFSKYESN